MEIKNANVSIVHADDSEAMAALFNEAFERGTVLGYKAAIYTFAQNFYPEGTIDEKEVQDTGTRIVDEHTDPVTGHITITNEEFLGKVYRAIVEKHGPPTLQPFREVTVDHTEFGSVAITTMKDLAQMEK